MTSRSRRSVREHILAVVSVALLVCWAVTSGIGAPLWNRFAELQRQGVVVRKKLERLQKLATRQPRIEDAYRRYASFWSQESDEQLQQAFLDELEQFARAGDLPMNLKPKPIQRQGDVSRLGVELDVEGTQDRVLAFLDQLLMSPSLIELGRLRITTASAERPLRATLLVTKVVVRP